MPNDVELAYLRENVDDDIVGGGRKSSEVVGGRERVGIIEKGEGNLGRVMKAEKGLVKEMGGKRNAVELKRRFHGVERIVVSE